MKLVQRHDLVDCAEFYTCVDEFACERGTMMLMHIDVHRFAPSAFRHMHRAFSALRNCTDALLFAIEPSPDDALWERFVTAFDFRFSSRVDYPDGSSRRVFISYKNEPIVDHKRHDPEYAAVGAAGTIPAERVRSGADEPHQRQ